MTNALEPPCGKTPSAGTRKVSERRRRFGEAPPQPSCDTCSGLLGDRPLCGLTGEEAAYFASASTCSLTDRGSRIFLQGDPAAGVAVVCHGKVKLTASAPDGRRVILRLARPGDVLGLRAVFSGQPYDATAEALEPTRLRFLPRAAFLALLGRSHDLGLKLACELGEELDLAYARVQRLVADTPAPERMLAELWALAAVDGQATPEGIRVALDLNRAELGELAGVARETVSRILAELERRGSLRVDGRHVTLLGHGPAPRGTATARG